MAIRITRSIIPNLFTLANLFCGYFAIILFSQSAFYQGASFILLAGIFDMLDGYMARLTNSASELGVELDSLCDAVSFGVAPSYLLYQVYFHNIENIGVLVSCLPAIAGVYRLARFNSQLTSLEDKQYFNGMPIPSGALTLVSFVIYFVVENRIPSILFDFSMFAVTIGSSLAMVSTIKYDNLPRPSLSAFKQNRVLYSVFFLGIILILLTKGVFAFPFMVLYIIFGASRAMWTWFKNYNEFDDDNEDDYEDDVENELEE